MALESGNLVQKLLAVILCGTLIGFLLPPLATYCLRVHQGYNLYNVGFAAGLVGTLIVSVMKSFGYETTSSLIWTYENDPRVIAYIFLLSASLMAGGWFMLDDKNPSAASTAIPVVWLRTSSFWMVCQLPCSTWAPWEFLLRHIF